MRVLSRAQVRRVYRGREERQRAWHVRCRRIERILPEEKPLVVERRRVHVDVDVVVVHFVFGVSVVGAVRVDAGSARGARQMLLVEAMTWGAVGANACADEVRGIALLRAGLAGEVAGLARVVDDCQKCAAHCGCGE